METEGGREKGAMRETRKTRAKAVDVPVVGGEFHHRYGQHATQPLNQPANLRRA